MSKLNKDAFAVMAMCERTRENFGITVNPQGRELVLTWAFKISAAQGRREGYEKKKVSGAVSLDDDFNGCPYCGSKRFYKCLKCGKMVCYHGQQMVTCPSCGITSGLKTVSSIDLSGGGY